MIFIVLFICIIVCINCFCNSYFDLDTCINSACIDLNSLCGSLVQTAQRIVSECNILEYIKATESAFILTSPPQPYPPAEAFDTNRHKTKSPCGSSPYLSPYISGPWNVFLSSSDTVNRMCRVCVRER